MKLRAIFYFEFSYQVRQLSTWLIFAALFSISFLMTRDGSLAEALHDEFFLNSPFAIAKTTVVGSLVWLLAAGSITGEAAARDMKTRLYPLIFTSPVSKAAYLGGRFLAAFMLNALILLGVQAGILAAVYSPGVDAALIGPFRPAAFLTAYCFIALPNALLATAVQFMVAARSGRPMTSFLGSLFVFFMSYILGLFLLYQGRQYLANLLDPIGVHFILSELSHLWTPIEKSTRLVRLEGTVLSNRLLWFGVALAALAITYLRFRFAHRTGGTWWWRRMARPNTDSALASMLSDRRSTPIVVPQAVQTFGRRMQFSQVLAFARDSFRAIAVSWAGIALLLVIPAMSVVVVLDQMELNGVPLVPTTVLVLKELTSPLTAELTRWVIIPLLTIFFAGELAWREQDSGLGEITGTMPGSEWVPLLGKFLGLTLLLGLFMALLAMAGIFAQFLSGYNDFRFGLYLEMLFGLQLPEYLLFANLALVVHVIVNHKYIGHLAGLLSYVFIIIAPMFGIEHNLLVYGAGPGWSYTDMRGFGASIGPWLWFRFYWAAWALLLAVAAKLLWVRGVENTMAVRIRLAQNRFTRMTAWIAGSALALILLAGGFIFYNTNVLNDYHTTADMAKRGAEYERLYKRFERIPQPRLAAANLQIEIYPERRAVEIRGTYQLVNNGLHSIDSIHLATPAGVATEAVAFGRPASLLLTDEDHGHRIYRLARPLQPGDSLPFTFQMLIKPHGFGENGAESAVVTNGTSFTNTWLPSIGYQQNRELTSPAERRKHGLSVRPLIPSLYDAKARLGNTGGSPTLDAVLGTSKGQVAVAHGALRSSWTKGKRRYFHYSTNAPGSEWAFFSANYRVFETKWQGVAIRIFHYPGHTGHLQRIVRSIRACLDYYSREFGPYPYNYLSVVERAGNGTGLHAEPGLITYAEGFSLWNPSDDPGNLDLPFAIMAHEMAHQWTVPYARVEGAPVMSESLAWYYGMKAVEHARGDEQLQLLLRFMREPYPYPPIRRGEPLLRGLDPYLAYRKGPFALYTLSEYVGEEPVNKALRNLRIYAGKHPGPEGNKPGQVSLMTTLDLYRELQAVTPDSLQPFLHDLFKVNTFWDFKTGEARTKQTSKGWQVTFDLEARKMVVDEAGTETLVPMNDWVEAGVFASADNGKEKGRQLYLQKHRIHSGKQTITIFVKEKPFGASVDPNRLLMELNTDDNKRKLKVVGSGG